MMLKKIPINGGEPIDICALTKEPTGADWGADEMIVYAEYRGPIMRISANGGKPEVLVEAEGILIEQQSMPDGKTVMFTQWIENRLQIVMQSIETGERKVLFPGHTATYLPTGHILYVIGTNLFAVQFDLDNLKVLGKGMLVVEGILPNADGNLAHYAVSDSGTLVYRPALVSEVIKSTLLWVYRDGKEEPLGTPVDRYWHPKISPDGRFVSLCGGEENVEIKVLDLERNNFMRLTFDEGVDIMPIWTLEGKRIVYTSLGKNGVYCKNADGTGQDEFIVSDPNRTFWPYSWSNDGKTLVMGDSLAERYDISILPMEGDRKRKPLLQEDYLEAMPQVSPDGQWIAYCSNESGQNEIYIRPFPDVDKGKYQASTTGGFSARWAPDGKELFYMKLNDNEAEMMAVKVETDPVFKLGAPKFLFKGPYGHFLSAISWDIHPDGNRFFMIKSLTPTISESTTPDRPKIIFVKNWFE